MKSLLRLVVVGVLFSLIPAYGEDEIGLTENSTEDQVSNFLDHLADKAIDQQVVDSNMTPDLLLESDKSANVARKLESASSKVLLSLLNHTRPYSKLGDVDFKLILKRQALYRALDYKATDADLPDILNSPAVEALWVICARLEWLRNPAVTSFLATQLDQLPPDSSEKLQEWIFHVDFYSDMYNLKPPASPCRTWDWTILDLASLSEDAKIQKQLVQAIRRGLDRSDTPDFFFGDAFEVAARSNNPDVLALTSDLMNRLQTYGRDHLIRVLDSVIGLMNAHPELIKDPSFTAAALSFIKTQPGGYAPMGTDHILLARLGDATSFGDAIKTYFDPDSFADVGQQQQMYRSSFHSEFDLHLLPRITYQGPGDRMEGIKANYHSATFKDGDWTVTAPDFHLPGKAESSPPLPQIPTPSTASPKVVHVMENDSKAALSAPPAPAPALPDRVAITARVPIETLDASGQVTGVAMATVGAAYHVLRAEGQSLILQDTSGTQYRVSSQAAAASK